MRLGAASAALLALLLLAGCLEAPTGCVAEADPPSYSQRRLSREQAGQAGQAGQAREPPKADWSSNNPQGSKVAAVAGSLVSSLSLSICRAHM